MYHYSSKPSVRVDQEKTEVLPAKGEIQERFNPRPYFEYIHQAQKANGGAKDAAPSEDSKPIIKYGSPFQPAKPADDNDKPPSVVYGTPFDSFPVFKKPQDSQSSPDASSGSDDIYNSPYSSYNPPSKPEDDSKDSDDSYNFPPLGAPPSSDSDDYGAPQDDSKEPQTSNHMPPSNTYLPPPPPTSQTHQQVPDDGQDMDDTFGAMNPHDAQGKNPQMMDDGDSPQDDHKFPGPYAYLPSYNSDIHDHGHHGKPYQPPDGHDDENSGPPVSYTVPPPNDGGHSSYLDHAPPGYDDHYHHYQAPHTPAPASPAPPPPMAEEDLSPPPANDAGYGQLPQYLDHDPKGHGYDFYGYDHHPPVYHEVETTTTEAPEDQRVNKGQYSYYYLGRKLWYIPLYFSIYFIIYVTVLILKSIARHKVQFKHNFDHKHRKARRMNIDDLHRNVTKAIENSENKYMYM